MTVCKLKQLELCCYGNCKRGMYVAQAHVLRLSPVAKPLCCYKLRQWYKKMATLCDIYAGSYISAG